MIRRTQLQSGDLAWFRETTWSWTSLGEEAEPDDVASPGTLVTVLEVRPADDGAQVVMPGGKTAWVNLSSLARVS